MKFKHQKITILALIIAVFISAIFCCCLTDFAQAAEPAPSCHQTNDHDTSQNSDECDCNQFFAITKKDVTKVKSLVKAALSGIVQKAINQYYDGAFVTTYQTPPQVYVTSPLYIKHSILRI